MSPEFFHLFSCSVFLTQRTWPRRLPSMNDTPCSFSRIF